jgi:predicted membrane protein
MIRATLSGQERKLAGTVPQELLLVARMGYVELDLRDAVFPPGVTVIDVRSFIGYVEIRLPEGIRVENHGSALFGYFAVRGLDEDSDSIVRITGRAVCGYAEVILPDAEAEEED